MHHHDQDLIAEFAGGMLDDDTEARRLVATCTDCAEEYRAQCVAIESLSGIAPATLTDHEKAALHRDLWTELRTGASAPSKGSRRWSWSWAYGGVAALFLAVAIVGVLNQMTASDSGVERVFSEIGRGLSSPGAPASQDSTTDPDGVDGAANDDEQEAMEFPYADIARSLRSDELKVDPSFAASRVTENCVERAGLQDHIVVTEYEEITDLIVVVPKDADLETAEVSFVDPKTCQVVHVED